MLQENQTNQYQLTNLIRRPSGELVDGWAIFSSSGVNVEFGGGFWHFGYELDRDLTKSNANSDYWSLSLYTEGQTNKTLMFLTTRHDN